MSGPLTCQLPWAGNAQKTLITPFQCCKGFAFWAPRTPQRECPAILLLCACLLQVCKQRHLQTDFKWMISACLKNPQDLLHFFATEHVGLVTSLEWVINSVLMKCFSSQFNLCALAWNGSRLTLIFKDQKPRAAAAIACNCQHLAPKTRCLYVYTQLNE